MTLTVTLGLLLSVVSLGCHVAGDPMSVLTITSAQVTNNPNEYFDAWTVDINKGKKSSQLSLTIPTKKELPPTLMMKITSSLAGQEPFEYSIPICDALSDPGIGASFVRAGIPKDAFPKSCPFGPGDWSILKWDPPVDQIPPGIPDGPVTGVGSIEEDGKPPYVQISYEGQLSHAVPSFGR